MIRVGFAGVPGAGKTSTARGLASMCRSIDGINNIELSAEYARRYIAKYGKIEGVWEQFRILNKQLDWENSVGDVDMLITDGPVFMALVYAQMLSMGTPKDIMCVNDLFSKMNKLNNPQPRYDIIFHLPPVLKPVQDGVRPASNFDPHWREQADKELQSVFQIFKSHLFHTVQATNMSDRLIECMGVIRTVKDTLERNTI